MKNLFLLLSFFLIFSCSRNEEKVNECKLSTVNVSTLAYDDINISSTYNPNFSEKIRLSYDSQNRISKILGSFIPVMVGSLGLYTISDDAYDEITYSGNSVYVKISANQMIRPYDKEFVDLNNKIASQKIIIGTNNLVYNYEYSGNQIVEKINNKLIRTFSIENGNLTKIEKWNYNDSNQIIGKIETIFSDFDNSENLLKNKFFINGAFIKAFSKNNFRNFETKGYVLQNGSYVSDGSYYTKTLAMTYNSENIANVFEKKCN